MPLRPFQLEPRFLSAAPSCLIRVGGTRVLCTATMQETVPPFLRGTGKGWLTAEYAMLPASTGARKPRDGVRRDGRGVEISRLIGRSLRQAIDLARLGERTLTIDCDVLEADGGTRTAAITGGFVALALAIEQLLAKGLLDASPIIRQIAAVSVGIVAGEAVLDLCYTQDSAADVDMNIVMDGEGRFIEIQGTGEGRAFTRDEADALLGLAAEGISALLRAQRTALADCARLLPAPLPRIILATNNPHKLRELKALTAGRYEALSLAEAGLSIDPEETGLTFAENALIKARAVSARAGCAALADDSGLMVDALHGAPGVHSARFAGNHGDDAANNRLLLERLRALPKPWTARFACAIALVAPGAAPILAQGEAEGVITDAPRGQNGFGYDPLFLHGSGLTFAEMTDAQKNAISHRALAVRRLAEALNPAP